MGTMSNTINGVSNGRQKTLFLYLGMIASLAVSITSLARSVFVSGDEMGRIEQHLVFIDQRLDSQDNRITRDEDRLQPELKAMREEVAQEREEFMQQRQLIEDLKFQLKIR